MCITCLLVKNSNVFLASDNHVSIFGVDIETIKNYVDMITAPRQVYDVGSKILQLSPTAAIAYGSSHGQKHRHILPYAIAELDYTTDPHELAQIPGLGGQLYADGKAYSIKNGEVFDINLSQVGLHFYTLPFCDEIVAQTFDKNLRKMSALQGVFKSIQELHVMTNGLIGPVPHISKFENGGEYKCIC